MVNVKEINIGDVAYIHDKIDKTITKITIKEIIEYTYNYFIYGVNDKEIGVRSSSIDNVFRNKEEAINSYLTEINKEIIKVITSI